jgi:hypothetical protein
MSRHLDETLLPAQDLKACPSMARWVALCVALAILAGMLFSVRDRLHPPPPAKRGATPQPAPSAGQPGH